mmetsp:Transcript_48659/g.103816  ORF Transcript_48659/g.103816 Transcript_48659/m.103816 type:complete len:109 (-) Transcript_48659:4-330(-)
MRAASPSLQALGLGGPRARGEGTRSGAQHMCGRRVAKPPPSPPAEAQAKRHGVHECAAPVSRGGAGRLWVSMQWLLAWRRAGERLQVEEGSRGPSSAQAQPELSPSSA